MSEAGAIFDRIRALMEEGDAAPTPSNYEFWYRYVSGADPELVEAVDAVRRNAGRLSARAIGNIRRELYGGAGRNTLGRLLDDIHDQLGRMSNFVEKSGTETRDYREQLDDSNAQLGRKPPLEQQRQMLAEMVKATSAMIETTEALENELEKSSDEIVTLKADLEIARTESRTDPLTGLANRKAGVDYLDAHVTRAHAELRALSLIFLDIDHFKRFNDNFGHRMGDEVLRLVANSLEKFFHGVGFPARWGGEEFVIVVPGRQARDAAEVAERFRAFISSRTVRAKQSHRDVGRITMSLGIAQLGRGDGPQDLIDRADRALYEAKAAGRNQVAIERPDRAAA